MAQDSESRALALSVLKPDVDFKMKIQRKWILWHTSYFHYIGRRTTSIPQRQREVESRWEFLKSFWNSFLLSVKFLKCFCQDRPSYLTLYGAYQGTGQTACCLIYLGNSFRNPATDSCHSGQLFYALLLLEAHLIITPNRCASNFRSEKNVTWIRDDISGRSVVITWWSPLP